MESVFARYGELSQENNETNDGRVRESGPDAAIVIILVTGLFLSIVAEAVLTCVSNSLA